MYYYFLQKWKSVFFSFLMIMIIRAFICPHFKHKSQKICISQFSQKRVNNWFANWYPPPPLLKNNWNSIFTNISIIACIPKFISFTKVKAIQRWWIVLVAEKRKSVSKILFSACIYKGLILFFLFTYAYFATFYVLMENT